MTEAKTEKEWPPINRAFNPELYDTYVVMHYGDFEKFGRSISHDRICKNNRDVLQEIIRLLLCLGIEDFQIKTSEEEDNNTETTIHFRRAQDCATFAAILDINASNRINYTINYFSNDPIELEAMTRAFNEFSEQTEIITRIERAKDNTSKKDFLKLAFQNARDCGVFVQALQPNKRIQRRAIEIAEQMRNVPA